MPKGGNSLVRGLKNTLIGGVVLVLLALAVTLIVVGGRWTLMGSDADSATSGGAPVVGSSGTGVAEEKDEYDPFAGSPAESYVSGAEGIAIPEAKATGGFPAATVKRAFQATKRTLAAAALDRTTLEGGKPDAFAKTLGTDLREYFWEHIDGKQTPTREWVTALAPGTAKLYGQDTRVDGEMSARARRWGDARVLAVKVDYIIVYAVQPPDESGRDGVERLVTRVSGEAYFNRGGTLPVNLDNWGHAATPANCDRHDGYIEPEIKREKSTSTATGPTMDPYDRSKPEPKEAGCSRATRT